MSKTKPMTVAELEAARIAARTALEDDAEYRTKGGLVTWDNDRVGRMLAREPLIARALEEMLSRSDVLDVGATDVVRKKTLILCLRWKDGCRYELVVDKSSNELTIVKSPADRPDSRVTVADAPDVVGDVLRRVVCRGIGKSEIIETACVAIIDLRGAPLP